MEWFQMIGSDTVTLSKAVLTVAGAFCALLLYLAHKYQLPQVRKGTLIGLGMLTFLSLLAYHNLGRFHRQSAINIYDTYHYYMGGKYFQELGYWYLYEATIVAADEDRLPRIRKAGSFRQQKTYVRARKIAAQESKPQWRERFTPERWAAFKQDLSFFAPRTTQRGWRKILMDKGYNPTPVWTMLGATLAQWIPARPGFGMLFLCYLDLVFILAIIAALWWGFGVETGLLAGLFIGINFTTPFGPIGGAFLRWDYCLWLILGLCSLKKQRPFLAGIFLAYAAMLRVSPALFMVGPACVGVYALVTWLRQLKAAPSSKKQKNHQPSLLKRWQQGMAEIPHLRATVRLGSGFLAGAFALYLLSLAMVPGGQRAWSEWVTKMELHQHSLGTKRYGLKYLFVWQGEVVRDDLRLDEGGWRAYDQRKQDRLADLSWLLSLLKVVFLVAFAWATMRRDPWEATALGVLLIFVLLSPTRYYYAQLIALVPLLTFRWQSAGRFLGFCLLMAAMLVSFFFHSIQPELAFIQFVVSVSLLLVFLYLLAVFIKEGHHAVAGDEVRQNQGVPEPIPQAG